MGIKRQAGTGSPHLSDEQLAQFEAGELSQPEASHLESCPRCDNRLRDAQAARVAYVEYRDSIRVPLLAPPPKPWKTLDALIARHQASHSAGGFRWWPAAALAAGACVIVGLIITALVLYSPRQTASGRASRLLSESAKLELPQRRFISLRVQGRTLLRPAVLSADAAPEGDPDIARLQMVFAVAHYSWREPLSARSFQAWRSRLTHKQDSVSVIRTQTEEESYRVRTETNSGILRTASLTLRAPDLRPVAGAFDFEREGAVELAEAAAPSEHASGARAVPAGPPGAPRTETPAGPEVTLHVLAALNQIGADAGEPVDISEDPQHQHVVVHAAGVGPERQRQIAGVLKGLPRVLLDFHSGNATLPTAKSAPLERYSASIPAPLRQQFEERFGGSAAFQETTDRVLEASASAVAQAHALEILARDFGPPVEASLIAPDRDILQKLRDNHLSELERLISRIRENVRPLLPAIPNGLSVQAANGAPMVSWQASAAPLVAIARKTDDSLNRLLASSYAQSSGEEMLRTLAAQIEQFDAAIRSERQAGR
jgi:hypothetical protein